MTRNPIAVSPQISFFDAATIMWQQGIGNLIVKEDSEPTGLLTERQILQYLVEEKEITNKPMGHIATHVFTRVTPTTSLTEAAKIMVSKKVRLLVFEDKKLIGIITSSDILRGFRRTELNPPLDVVIRAKVYKISYNDSLLDAIKIMHEKRVGSLIVIKDEFPYGIFTERDLLTNVLAIEADLNAVVGHYCSHPLKTAKLGIRAMDAAHIMIANGIKRLPLAKEGDIVGMITATDVVKAFIK